MTDQHIEELLAAIDEMREQASVINLTIYHFDLFMVRGKPKHLTIAAAGMKKYRALGGEDYKNAERCIKASLHTIKHNE